MKYFASSGVTNGPLTALSNSAAGGNGVYLYGASGGFPTNTYASSNYWVDVVFSNVRSSIIRTGLSIAVQPAAVQSLKVTGFPTSGTAGRANSFTITTYDAYGNVATDYIGAVDFSGNETVTILPSTDAFSSADAGAHLITVALRTKPSRSITTTDSTDKPSGA